MKFYDLVEIHTHGGTMGFSRGKMPLTQLIPMGIYGAGQEKQPTIFAHSCSTAAYQGVSSLQYGAIGYSGAVSVSTNLTPIVYLSSLDGKRAAGKIFADIYNFTSGGKSRFKYYTDYNGDKLDYSINYPFVGVYLGDPSVVFPAPPSTTTFSNEVLTISKVGEFDLFNFDIFPDSSEIDLKVAECDSGLEKIDCYFYSRLSLFLSDESAYLKSNGSRNNIVSVGGNFNKTSLRGYKSFNLYVDGDFISSHILKEYFSGGFYTYYIELTAKDKAKLYTAGAVEKGFQIRFSKELVKKELSSLFLFNYEVESAGLYYDTTPDFDLSKDSNSFIIQYPYRDKYTVANKLTKDSFIYELKVFDTVEEAISKFSKEREKTYGELESKSIMNEGLLHKVHMRGGVDYYSTVLYFRKDNIFGELISDSSTSYTEDELVELSKILEPKIDSYLNSRK